MKVSVCITTYNVEQYISQTLDSVLSQQTSFDYEIIIGDDYSTDNTRSILLIYKEKYPEKIVLHFQDKNVGVNKNDYDLIHLAKGEYIAWCDGDDYWIDNFKLEKEVQILDNYKNFSCVHTAWKNYYEEKKCYENILLQQKNWETILFGNKYIEKFLIGETTGCRFSSIMYRKKIILDFLNKDSSVYLSVPHLQNDFALFCIMAYYGPFYYINDLTTVYRIRKESLSQTNDLNKRLKYSIALIYLKIYFLLFIKADTNIVNRSIKNIVGAIFYYSFILNKKQNLINVLKELKKINYKISFGQFLIIKSFNIKILRALLKCIIYSK